MELTTFDTITAAINGSIPTAATTIVLNGYNYLLDGGEGAVYRAIPDPGTLAAHQFRSSDGRVWTLVSLTVTPQMFGAQTSDAGTVLDDVAFDALTVYMASRGNVGLEVVISKRHLVDRGWQIPVSNVVVRGTGTGEILCNMNGVNGQPGQWSGLGGIWAVDVSNVTVRDLKVTMRAGVYRDNAIFSVYFIRSGNIVVDRVFTKNGLCGIWLNSCSDSKISNCYVDSPVADGIHFSHVSKRCVADNNTVFNAGDDSIAATTDTDPVGDPEKCTSDITFRNNLVFSGRYGSGYVFYNITRGHIVDNFGWNLFGPLLSISRAGLLIHGSYISATGNKGYAVGNAQVIPASMWNGTPAENDKAVPPSVNSAICLDGVDRSLIAYNEIHGVGGRPGQRSAVYFGDCVQTRIIGNTISGVDGRGIWGVGTLFDAELEGNSLSDITGLPIDFDNNIDAGRGGISGSTFIVGNTYKRCASAVGSSMGKLGKTGTWPVVIRNNLSDDVSAAFDIDAATTFNLMSDSWVPFDPGLRPDQGSGYTFDPANAFARYRLVEGECQFEIRFGLVQVGSGTNLRFTLPRGARDGLTALKLDGRVLAGNDITLKGFLIDQGTGLVQPFAGANFTAINGQYLFWGSYRVS